MGILKSDILKAIAAGIVVLLILSIPLFWARYLTENTLRMKMLERASKTSIEPSGLVPRDIEYDPNLNRHSKFSINIEDDKHIGLGFSSYLQDRSPGGRLSDVINYDYDNESKNQVLYYDKKIGQFIWQSTYPKKMPDGSIEIIYNYAYAGPEGVSQILDKEIGRFLDPITQNRKFGWFGNNLIVFDRKIRRFFKIDFDKSKVAAGPQLPADGQYNPIQVTFPTKNVYSFDRDGIFGLRIHSPTKLITEDANKENGNSRRTISREETVTHLFPYGRYALVLDKSNRIDLLDHQTLQFSTTAGYLISPRSLYTKTTGQFADSTDLLAFQAFPIYLGRDWTDVNSLPYRGICVATLSREATSAALAVFDANGKLLKSDYSRFRGKPSAERIYFGQAWMPVWTIVKFVLENIHPPILSFASYFTPNTIEANAGHRALFLMPNSFVAMKARGNDEGPITRFFQAIMLLAPGIALAVFLAWWINIDAIRIGLSENTRLCWILAAAAFGLAAYITYRLTRPKITLVTCTNCGKQRRPDMNKCHRCSSKWMIPELTPPTWRVIDH
ncbi:MAG: hypothetical protein ACYSWP_15525 [Planctomycetota bacterium]|jgi:hypothetical protein